MSWPLAADWIIGALLLAGTCLALTPIQGFLGRLHLGHVVSVLLVSYGIMVASQPNADYPRVALSCLVGLSILLGLVGFYSQLLARVSDDTFALASLSSVVVFGEILHTLPSITGGSNGIRLGWKVFPYGSVTALLFSIIVAMICLLTVRWFTTTTLAVHLRALRDNAHFYNSLDYGPMPVIARAVAISAGCSAITAVGLTFYRGYISPAQFSLNAAFVPILALSLGRSDDWKGGLRGAFALSLLQLLLSLLGAQTLVVPVQYALMIVLLSLQIIRGSRQHLPAERSS